MKKVFGFVLLLAAVGMLAASCTPHKQACAAYSKVEIETPAQK